MDIFKNLPLCFLIGASPFARAPRHAAALPSRRQQGPPRVLANACVIIFHETSTDLIVEQGGPQGFYGSDADWPIGSRAAGSSSLRGDAQRADWINRSGSLWPYMGAVRPAAPGVERPRGWNGKSNGEHAMPACDASMPSGAGCGSRGAVLARIRGSAAGPPGLLVWWPLIHVALRSVSLATVFCFLCFSAEEGRASACCGLMDAPQSSRVMSFYFGPFCADPCCSGCLHRF